MKSIQLSLIGYFLALMVAVGAAVSVMVYRSMEAALRDKEKSSISLTAAQHAAKAKAVRDGLDRRLAIQANNLEGLAQWSILHFESLYQLGAIGAPSTLQVPLWLAESHPVSSLWFALINKCPIVVGAEHGDDLIPFPSEDRPAEYFQFFSIRGVPMQKSETLSKNSFALPKEVREGTKGREAFFDELELTPGKTVRRCVVKLSTSRNQTYAVPWSIFGVPKGEPGKGPPGLAGPSFGIGKKDQGKGPPLPRPGGVAGRRGGGRTGGAFLPFLPGRGTEGFPDFFVIYASEVTQRDAQLETIANEERKAVDDIHAEVNAGLYVMRTRLGVILAASLIALLGGGYYLLRLGLHPLHELSDAVSKVNAYDFALRVKKNDLPDELRPIVGRLEETLEQLKKAFEREKQAAADISHELRTPLAALTTTIDIALRKPRSPESYQETLEECRLSAKHMSHLVERLLALARVDAAAERVRLFDCDLSEIAEECVTALRPLASVKGLELRAQLSGSLPTLTDPEKIREILTNLLHNAIEYNRPNGTIDLNCWAENDHAVFEVRDTGIGITPADRERIFERFYRADPSRHAESGPDGASHCGLGLSIVKAYLELLGGSISVESDASGSTFRVRLPLRSAMAEPAPLSA